MNPIGCVPKRNGKCLVITYLIELNSHCALPKYKNEDIRDAASIYSKNASGVAIFRGSSLLF